MIANASELTSEAFAFVPLWTAAAFPSTACCGPRFQTALSSLWFCSRLPAPKRQQAAAVVGLPETGRAETGGLTRLVCSVILQLRTNWFCVANLHDRLLLVRNHKLR
jgi:hypothetical protein